MLSQKFWEQLIRIVVLLEKSSLNQETCQNLSHVE